MSTNPKELEPLTIIAAAAEIAMREIAEAWQPMADAGVALAKRLRGNRGAQ